MLVLEHGFFFKLMLYSAQGGSHPAGSQDGFFRSLVNLERWMWPLWPTTPPSGSMPLLFPGVTEVQAFHIFLFGPRANKSAGSVHDIPVTDPLSILLDRKNDAGLEIRSMTPGKTTQSCKGKGDDLGDIAFSTEPWLWKKMRSRLGNVLLLHYHLKFRSANGFSKWL